MRPPRSDRSVDESGACARPIPGAARPGARRLLAATGALLALAVPATAWADGPETLQARVAHAGFLAEAPAPPGGAGTVCIIDSGVDTDTDAESAIVKRFAYDGGSPDDVGALGDDGTQYPKHGTYVAGVIASQIDGSGSSGIWPRARIVSVRVFAGPSSGTTAADYVQGIDRCEREANVRAINLSIAGLKATTSELSELENAIRNARTLFGINVVAAAGNQALPAVAYPAQFPSVLAIGAIEAAGARWMASNYGTGLDISTLGDGVCVSIPGETTLAVGRGTSFAAPIVSAVIAAMRSYAPKLTVDQAEQALLDSAQTTGAGKTLDAAAAFTLAASRHHQPQLVELVNGYTPGVAIECAPPPIITSGGAGAGGGGRSNGTRQPVTPPAQVPATDEPVVTPAPIVLPALPAAQTARSPRTAQPTLRSVSLRRGVLRVHIGGFRRGMRVIYRVDRRRYVRQVDTLRVQTRTWKTLRIQLQAPGLIVSRSLVVRHGAEF